MEHAVNLSRSHTAARVIFHSKKSGSTLIANGLKFQLRSFNAQHPIWCFCLRLMMFFAYASPLLCIAAGIPRVSAVSLLNLLHLFKLLKGSFLAVLFLRGISRLM